MQPLKPKKVSKRWGHELWFANNEEQNYCGKILFIKKDKCTSLHYHADKHETFYVLDGELKLETRKYGAPEELQRIGVEGEHIISLICKKGESMEMPRGQSHKLHAHGGDLTLIETSTFHRDSDSYRLEEVEE